MDSNSSLSVTVRLDEVVDLTGPPLNLLLPTRILTLQAPDWSVKIGRSASSGAGPRQAKDNAWYSSRVISREHAELTADAETREVLIRDCGSMHGTHVDGRRLKNGVTERLYHGDDIVFGAEVARGDETFLPIEVSVSYTWSDGLSTSRPTDGHSRNCFTADYSEEDYDGYESEASLLSDSHIEPPPHVVNNFSVPESDISDEVSSLISYDDLLNNEYSPISSPINSAGHGENVNQNEENDRPLPGFRKTYRRGERLSPSLGDQQIGAADGYASEESYYDDSSLFDNEEEVPQDTRKIDESEPVDGFPEYLSSPLNIPALARHLPQPIMRTPSPPLDRTARKPSPSDAAMVKPPPQTQSPPFADILSTIPTSEVPPTSSSYLLQPNHGDPRPNTSAWAGHNSVLYDSCPGVPMGASCFMSQPPGPAYDPESSYFLPLGISSDIDPSNAHNYNAGGPSLCVGAAQLTLYPESHAGQKRKADHISEDNVLVPDTNEDVSATVAQALTVDPTDLNSVTVLETVESIKSPEPPRKKAKKYKYDSGARKHKNRSNFVKYAATAFAGAALGAAGTIWGLVALPKDFFV